ncbi:SMODS domain-containing nucleotidyltransferase [Ensifer sp. 22460]|uniref:SMODS domain-containing nucleotidyltransferase n=1 Tax=Ensifer sp. 22460 TaxID=3453922 RepID=UPI003F86A305
MGVAEEFTRFKDNYNIGKEQISSISQRYRRITSRLNKDFWNTDSETAHSLYVGSYGRDTAAKGLSDLDVGFLLPAAVYYKYDAYNSNGQSALLQAVRNSLQNTYSTSAVGGDGQVVVINFNDGVTFEILPAFDNQAGTWTYPDSNNGGSWRRCDPRSEFKAIDDRNKQSNGNLKHLCRMMRVWRDHNNAGMSGALIDTLAYQFMGNWAHRDKSFLYHDYMARDFLQFLSNQDKTQQYWKMPGSGQSVHKTGAFVDKAKIDYDYAVEACDMTNAPDGRDRRAKWRLIFGSTFPA